MYVEILSSWEKRRDVPSMLVYVGEKAVSHLVIEIEQHTKHEPALSKLLTD